MSMNLVKEIQKSDKLAALDREIPGKSCGNKECEDLCADVCKIAKNLGMGPKGMICDALEKEIVPKFKCRRAGLFADYPNKDKPIPDCRFGYTYGSHPDKTDAQLAAQQKDNINKTYNQHHAELSRGKGHDLHFKVRGSPGKFGIFGGGNDFNGIDDLLGKLEKNHLPHSIDSLVISNHGGIGGSFPLGNGDDLRHISQKQVYRLKKMLHPNSIVDIRMCSGASGPEGHKEAQKLANKFGCKILGYEGPVSYHGNRPFIVPKDPDNKIPLRKRILPDPKPKVFFPRP